MTGMGFGDDGPALLAARGDDEQEVATRHLFEHGHEASKRGGRVLLLTPSREWLDRCVAADTAAAAAAGTASTGSFEIRYYGTTQRLQLLLSALHLSPSPFEVVMIDNLSAVFSPDDASAEVEFARVLGVAIEATATRPQVSAETTHAASSLKTAEPKQLVASAIVRSSWQKRVCARVFSSLFQLQDGAFAQVP
eukprot:m.107301 g.107301  ORF g.107301 m.107301 type:complete len:194 (+) comp12745_c0_seq3:180-761(+)